MIEPDLSTVITFNPLVAYPSTSLVEMLQQWSDFELRNWPVVDDDGRLVGIISENDVVQAVMTLAAASPDDEPLGTDRLRACVARQFMSTKIVTISRWDSQSNGLYLLLKHQVPSLPVLEDGRLVGLISTADYLREFSYGDLPISREPVAEHVTEGTEPIDSDATLDEAAVAMLMSGADQLGVVSGSLPLGVVTAREVRLAKCRLECRRCLTTEFTLRGPATMRELATQSPIVRPGARLSEAAGLMVERQRQAIAVVTQGGRFVGSLSETDMLSTLASQATRGRRSSSV